MWNFSVYRWIIEVMKLTGTWGFVTTNQVQCLCFGHFVPLYLWKELWLFFFVLLFYVLNAQAFSKLPLLDLYLVEQT